MILRLNYTEAKNKMTKFHDVPFLMDCLFEQLMGMSFGAIGLVYLSIILVKTIVALNASLFFLLLGLSLAYIIANSKNPILQQRYAVYTSFFLMFIGLTLVIKSMSVFVSFAQIINNVNIVAMTALSLLLPLSVIWLFTFSLLWFNKKIPMSSHRGIQVIILSLLPITGLLVWFFMPLTQIATFFNLPMFLMLTLISCLHTISTLNEIYLTDAGERKLPQGIVLSFYRDITSLCLYTCYLVYYCISCLLTCQLPLLSKINQCLLCCFFILVRPLYTLGFMAFLGWVNCFGHAKKETSNANTYNHVKVTNISGYSDGQTFLEAQPLPAIQIDNAQPVDCLFDDELFNTQWYETPVLVCNVESQGPFEWILAQEL